MLYCHHAGQWQVRSLRGAVEDSTSGMRAAAAADMECVAYLGGGHAQKDWYLEKIAAFGIPITYSAAELLACLNDED